MTEQQAAERILALRQIIDYHSARYYDEDAPEIEDDEFVFYLPKRNKLRNRSSIERNLDAIKF